MRVVGLTGGFGFGLVGEGSGVWSVRIQCIIMNEYDFDIKHASIWTKAD